MISNIHSYQCVGLISGSSLDGLDIAHIHMVINSDEDNPISSWSIIKATTISYPEELVNQLKALPDASALEFVQMDDHLGKFYGTCVNHFIEDVEDIDFISSHGHTIFHHPGVSSTQIGNPGIITALTGIKTIGHLRNMDTAYGGQGAPLAPMADLYLFPEHDVCVNIGGIANISIKKDEGIQGFDVCGANQFLNYLAIDLGQPYDDRGRIARSGKIDEHLLSSMNELPYCQRAIPKSLDNEQVRSMYLPLLDGSVVSTQDKLATVVEHISMQLAQYVNPDHKSMHLAGGGAHNTFLVERIRAHCPSLLSVVVPEEKIINFKEALLIGMCGALRLHRLPNSLKTITGASKNTVNGVVFHP